MRRILQMIAEVARENNQSAPSRLAQLNEAYRTLDAALSGDYSEGSSKLAEALVVGDFPLYFARTLSRAIYDRYSYRSGTWKDYTYPDTVPDYSAAERFRFTEVGPNPGLDQLDEKQEANTTSFTEGHLFVSAWDFGKQIDFSHRILKNDDLGAFRNIAQMMGDSARRFEDWYVSALYDNALTQAALIALGALYAGTGRLTTANLMIAMNAFAARTDVMGNPLNLMPTYLVIPPILELTANQILQSERIAELATNSINPVRGKLQVRIDPYIATASPNIPWYLFAAPADVPAVTVVRMDGETVGPQLWTLAPDKVPMLPGGGMGTPDWRNGSFLTGDIEISVTDIIGNRSDALGTLVGVTDVQGIYYSTGTTA